MAFLALVISLTVRASGATSCSEASHSAGKQMGCAFDGQQAGRASLLQLPPDLRAEAMMALTQRGEVLSGRSANVENALKGKPPAAAALEAPVDFSGEWVLSEVKGSPDDVLLEIGYPKSVVTAMKADGYGKDSLWEEVVQEGDDITQIKHSKGKDPETLKLKVPGTTTIHGAQADVKWEGKSLVLTMTLKGGKIFKLTDSLEGDQRVRSIKCGGKEFTNIFIRKKA